MTKPFYKRGRVPLERALSKLGIASRTVARQWIEEGRVAIDGRTVRDPLRMVIPETVKIEVDNTPRLAPASLTVALHKTKGLVTTKSDEKNRPTVYSLLKDIKTHLIPIGRLDAATTGLLLLTNDTRFSAWVTDPKNEIERVYIVHVRGEFTSEKALRLKKGIPFTIAGKKELLSAQAIEILKSSGRESTLRITLCEGKNREIRRMLSLVSNEVTRLKRISFGGIELGDLAPGSYRELKHEELQKAFPRAPLQER